MLDDHDNNKDDENEQDKDELPPEEVLPFFPGCINVNVSPYNIWTHCIVIESESGFLLSILGTVRQTNISSLTLCINPINHS